MAISARAEGGEIMSRVPNIDDLKNLAQSELDVAISDAFLKSRVVELLISIDDHLHTITESLNDGVCYVCPSTDPDD